MQEASTPQLPFGHDKNEPFWTAPQCDVSTGKTSDVHVSNLGSESGLYTAGHDHP